MEKQGGQSRLILDAAFACISEQGYANVTTREIARRAGVVLSQLTYYYQNKENLFGAVMRSTTEKYIRALRAALDGAPSAREKCRAFVACFSNMVKRDPALVRVFVDFVGQAVWTRAYAKQLRDFFRQLREMVAPFLGEGEYARLLVGSVYGISAQSLFDGAEDAPERVFLAAQSLLGEGE